MNQEKKMIQTVSRVDWNCCETYIIYNLFIVQSSLFKEDHQAA